jgi:hypothetical protein
VNRAILLAGLCVLAGCATSTAVTADTAGRLVGAVDPNVTQANIHQTICKAGYTASVRPPVSYTAPIKRALWVKAGMPGHLADYELDHIVPLEVGGAARDLANLWLQPWAGTTGAHAKDAVENRVHSEVCAGTITLAVGERCFRIDWRACP